ncbi:MAG: LysM peptidoglycan-binding domain-containing protein, partial [Flavobacterium sp.]
ESIKKSNKIKKNSLLKGQILTIKTNSNVKEKTSDYAEKNNKNKTIHKVKKGESLRGIADNYGVSEAQLKKWNPDKIEGNKIFSGTRLKIYSNEPAKGGAVQKNATKYYKVRKGDTLFAIAQKFGVSVSSLAQKNKKTEKNLKLKSSRIIKKQM